MPTIVDNSEKREGEGRLNTRDGTPVIEETYHYLVKADYAGQARLDILLTTGLPVPGVTIRGYTICKGVAATRRPDAVLYWDITANFSSEVKEGSDGHDPSSSDPNTWVPVYETKWEPIQEVVAKDLSGVAIANSVGQPFETGLTITRKIPMWEFYQFEPVSVTDETIIDRHDTINSGVFKGRDPETLLLSVLSSVVGFYYGQRRRLTQYQLKYNVKKWTHKRLDVGTKFLDAAGDQKAYKTPDINGDLVQVLGSLDGAGAPAGGYETTTNHPLDDRDNTAVLEFDIYEKSSFSFLRK